MTDIGSAGSHFEARELHTPEAHVHNHLYIISHGLHGSGRFAGKSDVHVHQPDTGDKSGYILPTTELKSSRLVFVARK